MLPKKAANKRVKKQTTGRDAAISVVEGSGNCDFWGASMGRFVCIYQPTATEINSRLPYLHALKRACK